MCCWLAVVVAVYEFKGAGSFLISFILNLTHGIQLATRNRGPIDEHPLAPVDQIFLSHTGIVLDLLPQCTHACPFEWLLIWSKLELAIHLGWTSELSLVCVFACVLQVVIVFVWDLDGWPLDSGSTIIEPQTSSSSSHHNHDDDTWRQFFIVALESGRLLH